MCTRVVLFILTLAVSSVTLLAFQTKQYGYQFFDSSRDSDLILVARYSTKERNAYKEVWLRQDAAKSLQEMIDDASADGVSLFPLSGYRSYQYQQALYKRKQNEYGNVGVNHFIAPPGYSEHHTGRAIDIAIKRDGDIVLGQAYADQSEYEWLHRHAPHYGFELSYPKRNTSGVAYEPWHWRFIGTVEAKQEFASSVFSRMIALIRWRYRLVS